MANGLLTNKELVDTIIVDLNNLLKEAMSGQYIRMCSYVTQISQKLANLRTTIDSDLKSRDDHIEDLKNQLKFMTEKNKNGGADNGEN